MKQKPYLVRLATSPGAMLVKTLFYAYFYATLALRRLAGRAAVDRVFFAPLLPGRPQGIWKVCMLLGALPTPASDSSQQPAVHQSRDTEAGEPDPRLSEQALNRACLDIGKARVERIFEKVFGYQLAVDPTTCSEPFVEKSNRNAAHDGHVLREPVAERRPGCVYEVLVDNRVGDGEVEDVRACIVGASMPVVYRKRRPVETRFSNDNTSVEVVTPDDCFTAEEQQNLLSFARSMGLDFGELDVLRDRGSGRIYVVDVNKTPHAPPELLVGRPGIRVMRQMARAFEREFLAS